MVCQISFGTAFKADGPLMNMAPTKDGKKVLVVGLTPHTVDLTINIPFEHYRKALNITNWHHDNDDKMIEKLKTISFN